MQMPANKTMAYITVWLSPNKALATGMANMARPTPNQPAWVKLIMALGR